MNQDVILCYLNSILQDLREIDKVTSSNSSDHLQSYVWHAMDLVGEVISQMGKSTQ